MKKVFIFFLMLQPIIANADAVEIDGLYYDIVEKAKEAELVENPNKYIGSISIPDSIFYEGSYYRVVAIGYHAFDTCTELKSVSIPSSVKTVKNYAFHWCGYLNSVSFSEGLESIGEGAFQNCASLTEINLPQSITSIDRMAFNNCQSLRNVNIPNSIKNLGSDVFYGCGSLESVIIPDNIKIIPSGTFGKCKGLKSVTIPSSVVSIKHYAFGECSSLDSVYISDLEVWLNINFDDVSSNPFINGAELYLNNEKITELELPNSVQFIKSNVFAGVKIEKLIIPNTVTEIGERAFYGCEKMKSITLGESVNMIGLEAFAYCKNLEDVYCYAKEIPTTPYSNIFDESYINYATLHVPSTLIEKYKSQEPWSSFKEIVALTDYNSGIDNLKNNVNTVLDRYTIGGQTSRRDAKGLNILRMSNGKTIKVITK